MKPGEYRLKDEPIDCNKERETKSLRIANTGDRPIQVGSHYHFAEVNRALSFDRGESIGMRLNIAAGTAVRFEPGEEKEVELTALGGRKYVYGLNDLTRGSVEDKAAVLRKAAAKSFKGAGEQQ